MESLSAESKLLYGILMSETDEIYEAKWASYRARASAAAATARSTTRSTAPLRAPSDSAAAASASSATSSTTTGPTTPAASNLVLSFERETTDEFTPEARPLYDLLVGGSASPTPSASSRAPSKAISTGGTLESASATAVPEKDIRSVTPTNCSTICPGGDTSAASTPSSQVASSAFTPASSTSVSAALVSPAVGVLLESDDHITLAPPAICLILRPSPSATIDTVVSEVCSISLVLASGASTLPATFLVDNVDTAKHTENRLQPWPPPRYAISQEENMCKDMPQVLLWHWFVLESTQLMLWAAKNPWPPPFPNISTVFCFASCGILNLHSTLDNLQLSRDCQVLKTMTIGYSVVLLVSTSVPGVPSIQLQPTLFKWPVSFCYDTHLHIASTSVESLLDLLFTRRAMSIFCTWCYMHDLHWPPGGTTMAIPDWGMLISSIETWVHMTGDFASVYFRWAITVQQSTSSGAYLVILNERAELQQRYTCERVLLLPLVVCKGWMSQLILQGQPHYFELMQWSFSHTQQQSAFCFFTPGHLLFPCCAVVQWKIPWIIILVSLRSWFQCSRAQAESLCSWENFQWTNAWSLSYHLSLSIPLLFSCPLLVKLVELKTVAFSNVCLNLTTGTVVFECSSSTLTTAGMRSVCVQLEQLKMVQCLHYKEPPELNICASATQAMSWTEIQPTRQVWTVLLSYQNGDSVEHSFDQVMEKLTCPTITCELHYSSLVIEELLAAPYSSWCMRCVNHDIEETQECVLFLQPKPPWSLLEPNISIDGFMSNLIIASECMHVTIIYLALNQFGIESATKWLQMQLVGGYWTFKIAFWFSWDISCTIDSETSTKHISCTFSHAVQNLEPLDYFSVAMLVLSSSLSQAWVLYLSVACILRWGSELMTWEIASSEDDILAYTERVLTPWDPGGSDLVPVATWNITQLQFLHLTWDPGGCTQHRLEVKPILKEWGLSTTYLYSRLVWIVGRFFWARPAQEPNKVGTREHKYEEDTEEKGRLENGRTGGGFGRGAWLGECGVCCWVPLLPP